MSEGTPVTNTSAFPTTQEPTILPKKAEYFGGCRVFDVTNDEYLKLMRGTNKWSRWNKYFNDATEKDSASHSIRKHLYQNPSRTLVLRNMTTQDMVYFKPRSKGE